MLTVGENMARCRKRKGMSQRTLAELIGSSETLIYRYEHNEVAPGLYNLVSIADALEVSIDELIGRKV